MDKIIAFFMSIWLFIANLFGININIGKVEILNDIVYGNESNLQQVDIYISKDTPKENVGLILYIHGGGWVQGSKDSNSDSLNNIAKNYGYVTASMDYRLFDNGAENFEDMLDDIELCLAKIKSVCAERGINITSCALQGNSAGSHLAMLYAYSRKSSSPIPIKFVVDYCGPTDLSSEAYLDADTNYLIAKVLGLDRNITKEDLDNNRLYLMSVSPVNYALTAVPTIIAHGDADSIVPYQNAVDLSNALKLTGTRYDFVTFKDSDHDMSNDADAASQTYSLYESYCREYFGY